MARNSGKTILLPLASQCNWEATGKFNAGVLPSGTKVYRATVGLMWVGLSCKEQPTNPVYLNVGNYVYEVQPDDIPLCEFKNFFVEFTPDDTDKWMTFTATTEQPADSMRPLLVDGNQVNIYTQQGYLREPVCTVPLMAAWNWFAVGSSQPIIPPASEVQVSIPLMLRGSSRDGWTDEVMLQVQGLGPHPVSKQVPPSDIPLGKIKCFPLPPIRVPGGGGGKAATITVSTLQYGNIESLLHIGDATINY